MDAALVQARVAGRQAANELADLYITESARLKEQHGLEASIAFLETLRDNLLAIRPLAPVTPVTPPVMPEPAYRRSGFSADECPDDYVVVDFHEEMEAETDRAILIGNTWIPKSQIWECPERGEYVESLAIRQWFVDKEGLG